MRSPLKKLVSAALLALCVLSATAEPAVAQDDGPSVRTLMRQFRNARGLWEERDAAARELVTKGPDAARQLASAASTEFHRRHKKWVQAHKSYLSLYQREATRVGTERLRSAPAGEVEKQREKLLKYSRSSSLTKDQVKRYCDEALFALEGLLQVSAAGLLDESERLREEQGGLLDEAMDLEWLAEVWDLAVVFAPEAEIAKLEACAFGREIYKELRETEELMALSGVATEARDKSVLADNQAIAGELLPEEYKGLFELNRIRILAGIGALKIDAKLCLAGRDHSKDMVEHDFFSHTSPLPGKRSPGDRARLAGTSGGGENIAAGQETGGGAIRAWWYSPGHHRNMMGGYGRVGLGQYEDHWTQMFG
ncbi:MAG: CAP domain-containing protein [Planctomycetes bacterium]|nr:CAP domain-containing protein [Planctomycetota bacterium]